MTKLEPYVKMIVDPTIREFTRKALAAAPEYFWKIPASSSGKYHPKWALEEGGLVKHTMLTMYLAFELARTFGLTDKERDIAVSAAALHDTIKYGVEYDERYHYLHPYIPRTYYGSYRGGKELDKLVGGTIFDAIMNCIERHMGCLAEGAWHSVGRTKPENRVEMVVHLADYTASRQKINFADFLL